MLTKYNLYIGLNDKDSKQQEISTLDAYKIVGARLVYTSRRDQSFGSDVNRPSDRF